MKEALQSWSLESAFMSVTTPLTQVGPGAQPFDQRSTPVKLTLHPWSVQVTSGYCRGRGRRHTPPSSRRPPLAGRGTGMGAPGAWGGPPLPSWNGSTAPCSRRRSSWPPSRKRYPSWKPPETGWHPLSAPPPIWGVQAPSPAVASKLPPSAHLQSAGCV